MLSTVPKGHLAPLSLVWWLSVPRFMPCSPAHRPSAVAPGSAGPHPQTGRSHYQETVSALWIQQMGQSAHYLQWMCSRRSSISGAWKMGVGHAVLQPGQKQGLRCRKLRHLGDHPWVPTITGGLAFGHWALIWLRVCGS